MLVMARLRRPSPGTVLGGLALIVATSGVAVAAIPESDGVIHGCYSSASGQLRVIDTEEGDTCAVVPWKGQASFASTYWVTVFA